MTIYYFDTSAIVKRYSTETGTAWVTSLTLPTSGNDIYLSQLTAVEVIAAITRRMRGGSITASDGASAITQFRHDLINQYDEIEITPSLIARAIAMAQIHGLRGYDAVQLASAIEINTQMLILGLSPITLISADQEINNAATLEGLIVDDPNSHP